MRLPPVAQWTENRCNEPWCRWFESSRGDLQSLLLRTSRALLCVVRGDGVLVWQASIWEGFRALPNFYTWLLTWGVAGASLKVVRYTETELR